MTSDRTKRWQRLPPHAAILNRGVDGYPIFEEPRQYQQRQRSQDDAPTPPPPFTSGSPPSTSSTPLSNTIPLSPFTSPTNTITTTTTNPLSPYSSNDPPTYEKIAHTFTPLSARPKAGDKEGSGPSPLAQIDPVTHLPATFRINSSYTPPFATIPQIIDHLTFLACLHCLQEDVRDAPFQRDDIPPRQPAYKPRPRNGSFVDSDSDDDDYFDDGLIDGDVKWTAFCLRAAARFDLWATSDSLTALADQVLSSGRPLVDRKGNTFLSEYQLESVLASVDIDILMAWHTYMLNPSVYADDMERAGGERGKLRGLKALGHFPLSLIVSEVAWSRTDAQTKRIDPETYVFQPRHKAGEAPPFAYTTHPTILVSLHATRTTLWMRCASCAGGVEIPVVGPPPTGTGLVSHNMAVPCPHCGFVITHDQLLLDRMVRDLADVHYQRSTYLPGLAPSGGPDGLSPTAAVAFSRALVEGATSRFMGFRPLWYDNAKSDPMITTAAVGERCGWTVKGAIEAIMNEIIKEGLVRHIFLEDMVSPDTKHARALLRKALARYARVYSESYMPTISFDLGAAIMRQAAFVGNMEKIGWLEVARWREVTEPSGYYLLQKAAARYREWL